MVHVASQDPSVLLISPEDPCLLGTAVAVNILQRNGANLSLWIQATKLQGNVGLGQALLLLVLFNELVTYFLKK